MISVSEALNLLIEHRSERPVISASLSECSGAVLAIDVKAKLTLPPLTASAMDGYAVRLADVREAGTKLTVIGEAPAGHPFQGNLGRRAVMCLRQISSAQTPQVLARLSIIGAAK